LKNRKRKEEFMKRKEKQHWKKLEKENSKKKDIDQLPESRINLKQDNIMKKTIIIKIMIEKILHIRNKKELNQLWEDKLILMNLLKIKEAILPELKEEHLDMRQIIIKEMIISQKDQNLNH